MAIIVDRDKRTRCKCGCGKLTSGIRLYKNGNICYAKYVHGHHKGRLGVSRPAWNKGLTKSTCPTLARMGYQRGHTPYSDWSKINERLKSDPVFKEKWRDAKRGKRAWNKGLTRSQYPHGIVSGEQHGNWCGNTRGSRSLAGYMEFRLYVLQRDNFTCQQCGDRNRKGRGKRIVLHVHHKTPVAIDKSLAIDPDNAITLCYSCHKSSDTFGTKVVRLVQKLRKHKS